MGRNNLSKRRSNVSKRRNKITKRRNNVSKRRNKITKRRNKVSKRRNNHKKLLGGASHKCFYVDNPIDGVACNAYFYDNDGWYYWKGWGWSRWEKADMHAKVFYDHNNDRYICPKHVEQYRNWLRSEKFDSQVRVNTLNNKDIERTKSQLLNDWSEQMPSDLAADKSAKVKFGKVDDDDNESHDLYECPPPKEYAMLKGLGKGLGSDFRKKVFRMVGHSRTAAVDAKICGPDTPFLTDNGRCCSEKDE